MAIHLGANNLIAVSTSETYSGQPFWRPSLLVFIGQNPYSNLDEKLIKVMHINSYMYVKIIADRK